MTDFDTLLQEEIYSSVVISLCQDMGLLTSSVFANGIPDSSTITKQLTGELDVTASLVPSNETCDAHVITKEDCIFVGKAWVELCFKLLAPEVSITWSTTDGKKHAAGDTLFTLSGNTRAILTAERSALNFAQTLSATATTTAWYASILSEHRTEILDTRKTIPGMRFGQKYAVKCGGGSNHRIGLYDRFLIKENHIIGCGSIAQAVQQARQNHQDKLVEVEVENLHELQQAIDAKADIVMLDNFNLTDIEKAVALTGDRLKLEVSGNIEETQLLALAKTGVDFISSGALTKHIKAIDLSLRLKNSNGE